MSYVEALSDALDLQVQVIDRVRPDDLQIASRCPGWSIRDVLEHSVAVTHKFTEFAAGITDEPHAPGHDILGGDHSAALAAAAMRSVTAWQSANLSRTCRLSFGTFPAELAAGINLFDVLAHTWDIAAALGFALPGDDELWLTGLQAAQRVVPPERDEKHYARALGCDAGAQPMVRFLAYLGRRASP